MVIKIGTVIIHFFFLIAESVVKTVRKRVPGLEGVLIVREFVERISVQESPGG